MTHKDPSAMTRDELISRLEKVEFRLHGVLMELMDVKDELAPALGYPWSDEMYTWVTGDHTAVTLAMEARRKLKPRLGEEAGLDSQQG